MFIKLRQITRPGVAIRQKLANSEIIGVRTTENILRGKNLCYKDPLSTKLTEDRTRHARGPVQLRNLAG